MTKTLMNKMLSCALALVLAAGLLPVMQPEKAYAATTITQVELNVDFDAIPLNAATTGRQANQVFRDNSGISEDTMAVCGMDGDYSFLAKKMDTLSNGKIGRKKLDTSDELLTKEWTNSAGQTQNQYYLVFNLIQKSGYEFPSGDVLTSQVTVKVNGATLSGVEVNRYNTNSIDVYVPIAFDDQEILESCSIRTDTGSYYVKAGTPTMYLSVDEVGKTTSGYLWTLSGNSSSATKLSTYGTARLTVGSDEPDGTQLTITATSKKFPEISDTIIITVISDNPKITSISCDPTNTSVDVSSGVKQVLHYNVTVVGTAHHKYEVIVQGAHEEGTKVTSQDESGFDLSVNAHEPSGVIRMIVRSTADTTKSKLLTLNVTGVHRVDYVNLIYDDTKLFLDTSNTAGTLKTYLTSNYIAMNSAYTYADMKYSFLAEVPESDWSRANIRKLDDEEYLSEGKKYCLVVNVENKESGTERSLWPSDLSTVSVYANGRQVGVNDYGHVGWYSDSGSGSIEVYIPLQQKAAEYYYTKEFAPGIYAVCVINHSAGRALDQYWPMKYRVSAADDSYNTMYYSDDTKTWYYLVSGTEAPVVGKANFTSAACSSQEFYPYQVTKPGYAFWDEPGDVNGSGKLNVVDAQVVYDVANGQYSVGTLAMKRILMCDVNGDAYVDAADAFAVQQAIFKGWQ